MAYRKRRKESRRNIAIITCVEGRREGGRERGRRERGATIYTVYA